MKLINLVENTPGDPACHSAHGLSFYIQTPRHHLLLDAGPGPVLVENADALGVDLTQVDTVVLSHGHYDHADGLPSFAARNRRARLYLHRGADALRYSRGDREAPRENARSAGAEAAVLNKAGDRSAPLRNPRISNEAQDKPACISSLETVPKGLRYNGVCPDILTLPNLVWTEGRVDLDEELSLFDGASHALLWPRSNLRLLTRRGGELVCDPLDHEQYLVIREGEKRVLLSGCAHKGIVNILLRFRALYGGEPDAVVSGFHLMNRSGVYTEEELRIVRETACRLRDEWSCQLYTCHCTGLTPFAAMKEILGERLRYVHCGERFAL